MEDKWIVQVQADRARIIAPILATEKGTAERAEAFRKVAAQVHVIRGSRKRVSESSLRDWVRAHEAKGLTGVIPAVRADKGLARVLITREWDSGIDLPPDVRGKIAERVARVVRTQVLLSRCSVRKALRMGQQELLLCSRVSGSALPDATLQNLCRLNTKWAKRIGLGSKSPLISAVDLGERSTALRHRNLERAKEVLKMVQLIQLHGLPSTDDPAFEALAEKLAVLLFGKN